MAMTDSSRGMCFTAYDETGVKHITWQAPYFDWKYPDQVWFRTMCKPDFWVNKQFTECAGAANCLVCLGSL